MALRTKNNKGLGTAGEAAAAEYLRSAGFEIKAINFRYGRIGEIDIICFDGEYICFVEVKTRSGSMFGSPCEAVTGLKQRNICRLAQVYLLQNKLAGANVRFDVVEVFAERKEDSFRILSVNHIPNAF